MGVPQARLKNRGAPKELYDNTIILIPKSMTTLKIKFRKSAVAGKAGTLYYQLIHRGKIRRIGAGVHLQPGCWDGATGRVIPRDAESAVVQDRIERGLERLRGIVASFEAAGTAYSVDDVARAFCPEADSPGDGVLHFMRRQIELLIHARRLGTAGNYRRAHDSFARFLQGGDLPLGQLTDRVIERYNVFLLRRGVVRNTVSFYMRILRAVYNKAVRRGLVPQHYPFVGVYTGIDRTRKRAVDRRTISRLDRLDLEGCPALGLARDLFLFSFCARGMAFVDMAYLRRSDVRGGTIAYVRRKTGQVLRVGIEPRMRALIERYAARDADSPYVFPVLTARDEPRAYRQYRAGLDTYNRMLGRLSEMIKSDCKLTSYTPRHSWATAARDCRVPLSVISAGLGHASERTTQIYLSALEDTVVDAANRKVLAMLG